MESADAAHREAWVICLCAEWCGVCREWRAAFERAAAEHEGVHFAWIDVEDEAAAMGDVDIETFPTLLIADDGRPVFFGPVLPSAAQFSRLLGSLLQDRAAATSVAPEAGPLFRRLTPLLRNS
jgi:thioredoxin-like negative regulator of GroEL